MQLVSDEMIADAGDGPADLAASVRRCTLAQLAAGHLAFAQLRVASGEAITAAELDAALSGVDRDLAGLDAP